MASCNICGNVCRDCGEIKKCQGCNNYVCTSCSCVDITDMDVCCSECVREYEAEQQANRYEDSLYDYDYDSFDEDFLLDQM